MSPVGLFHETAPFMGRRARRAHLCRKHFGRSFVRLRRTEDDRTEGQSQNRNASPGTRCTVTSNASHSLLIQITELLLNFSRNHNHIYGLSVSSFGINSSSFTTGDQWMRRFKAHRHLPYSALRGLLAGGKPPGHCRLSALVRTQRSH